MPSQRLRLTKTEDQQDRALLSELRKMGIEIGSAGPRVLRPNWLGSLWSRATMNSPRFASCLQVRLQLSCLPR